MNYNYGLNNFDGPPAGEVNNYVTPSTAKIVNGKMRNISSPSSPEVRTIGQLHQQASHLKSSICGKVSLNECSEAGLQEKRLKFSEKLKVLLKNGGSKNDKIDSSDPYAFSEIDPQFSVPLNQALNNVDSYIKRSIPPNMKLTNFSTQKSIMFPKPESPKMSDKEDCNNSEAKNNFSSMKLAKIAVPVYTALSNSSTAASNMNQSMYKMQATPQIDRFKTAIPRNVKTFPAQLPPNSKPSTNKSSSKPTVTSLKTHTSLSNPLKVNKNMTGKPQSFGQMTKHGNAKMEKKIDSRNQVFSKGKPFLNQLHKTVTNKSSGKNKKSAPARSNSADADVFMNRSMNKKSLLEESLLGLKSNAIGKEQPMSSLKQRPGIYNCNKVGYPVGYPSTPIQTGTATVVTPPRLRTESMGQAKHESLQRIWTIRNKLKGLKRDHHHFGLTISDVGFDENSSSECLLFQNYWFSVSNDYDSLSYHDRRRDTKLSQLKIELRHKIKQLQWRYKDEYRDRMVDLLIDSARKQPNLTAFLIRLENSQGNGRKKISRSKPSNVLRSMLCSYTNSETGQHCEESAMPFVKYCQQHIMLSSEQFLFTECSALQSDNTTCRAPVLNQTSDNPLCLQHKRLEKLSEKPKKLLSSKPVSRPLQPRKRSRSSTGGSSRSGRSRKRKRLAVKDRKDEVHEDLHTTIPSDSSSKFSFDKQNEEGSDSYRHRSALSEINPQVVSKSDIDESQEVEVGEEVLAIAADLPLELATQATRLLEEHDFTNVLNHIPADAFNDLFTEDKEEYEPTPQETEELERALEAVDKDVKSLEKLSATQGILDTLLDEQTIAQTLAQLPEVTTNLEVPPTLVPVFYHNGFTNMNQLEQTLHDVNKSLTHSVLLNQGTDVITNHFVTNLTIPNHADVLQS